MKRFSRAIALLAAVGVTGLAAAEPARPRGPLSAEELALKKANGSYHVQCDGQPDNMTGGETAARLIGAVTLLGLFAPPPEAADPAKRKFGADGVAACTTVIEGARAEGSPNRLYSLILARGAHRIEAKDYAGAIADAKLARRTAADAGLAADPLWLASRGRGADLLEGAALYRTGRMVEADAVALPGQEANRYALLPLLGAPRYFEASGTATPGEAAFQDAANRAFPWSAAESAARAEQLGRFADAAALRDALVELDRASTPGTISSLTIAQAAVAHALAGQRDRAAELAQAAQANFDRRKAEGKPDADAAQVVEQLDLYGIVRMADAGDVKGARRLFAARSQWVSASPGCSIEVARRLRTGASGDELIGGLALSPEELWKKHRDEQVAQAVAKDSDNKTLFAMTPVALKAADYEAVAKGAWKVEKSPWLLKLKKPDPELAGWDTFFNFGASPQVMPQAYMLHAALLAQSRGQQGFVILPVVAQNILAVRVKTGNPGDPGLAAPIYNDAARVIRDLSPLIPGPDELQARQAARARAPR